MNIIGLIICLAIIGVGLWYLNTYLPMPQWIRVLINLLIGLVIVIWLLNAFGVNTGLPLHVR